jgi:hypothetical protein
LLDAVLLLGEVPLLGEPRVDGPPPGEALVSPTITLGDPSMSRPSPPQCFARSFRRCADLPLMKTVSLPAFACHVLVPQHAA